MPYTFEPYRDDALTGTIGQLIAAPGRIAAEGALQKGQIAADEAKNLGNIVTGTIGSILQEKRQKTTDDFNKLQLSEAQKHVAEGDALKRLIYMKDDGTKTGTPRPLVDLGNGVMGYDIQGITEDAAKLGVDPTRVLAEVQPQNQNFQQIHQLRMQTVQQGADSIARGGNDPGVFKSYLSMVAKNGVFPKETTDAYMTAFENDPTKETVAKITSSLGTPPTYEMGAPGSVPINKATGLMPPGAVPVPNRPVRPISTPGGVYQPNADGTPGAIVPDTAPKPPAATEWTDFKAAWANKLGKDVNNLNGDDIINARKAMTAANEKPEQPLGKDTPDLPRGAQDYIVGLTQEKGTDGNPLTYAAALTRLTAALPELRKDHPALSSDKAVEALRKAFGPDPTKVDPFMAALTASFLKDHPEMANLLGAPSAPAQGPAGVTPPPAPASNVAPVTPPAGAPPVATAPPPVVQSFFKGKGAGTQTFSDGSVWHQDASGKLTKVK